MQYRDHQKFVERNHLELLLSLYFGAAELTPRFGESPDLLIDVNDTTIGIEHTQCFLKHDGPPGLAPVAQEVLQNKIIWKAWNFFKQNSEQPLWVIVAFEDTTAYFGNDVDIVARTLTGTLEQFLNQQRIENVWYRIEAWRVRRASQAWPAGIAQVDVQIVPDARLEMWGPGRGYVVPHLQTAEVQAIIDTKNQRVSGYLQQCSQVWLLIVVDDASESSHFAVDNDLLNYQFSTAFTKLFLLRRFHEELFELRVK